MYIIMFYSWMGSKMNMPLSIFNKSNLKLLAQWGAQHLSSQPVSSKQNSSVDLETEGEFRVLNVRPTRIFREKKKRRATLITSKAISRTSRLDPDTMDWKSVWPGPRTFDPHSVPLPVRQGYLSRKNVPYNKYANLELMKIPNFLHLTPPAIKAHCEELKKFCTPFPQELNSRAECEKHFPIAVTTNDYLHSSPTIRDPLARVVTLKVNLNSIPLDEHAKDKMLRLLRECYNPETNCVTIVTDRCPMRKQNYDYAQYLLTAIFFESWKVEPWEREKEEKDMEKYIWQNNASARTLASLTRWSAENCGKVISLEPLLESELKPEHLTYREAVTNLIEDETDDNINDYKNASLQLLLGVKH